MATHSCILAWRIPMDSGAHGVAESQTWLSNSAGRHLWPPSSQLSTESWPLQVLWKVQVILWRTYHTLSLTSDLEAFLIVMVFNLDSLSWEFFLQDYFIHVPWIDPDCKWHLWVKTSLYSLTPKQHSMWHIISTYQNNSCLHHWA